jgi:F0F1-type ATP synthase delta subunit
MKRILSMTTAVLLGSSLLGSPVLAQGLSGGVSGSIGGSADVGVGVGGGNGNGNSGGISGNASGGADVGVSGNVGNSNANGNASGRADGNASEESFDLDTSTTASASANSNFGQLISSIRASANSSTQIDAMTDASDVTVVEASTLIEGNGQVALENAVEENQDSIEDLRTSIQANADLMAELENQGVTDLSSVVAAIVNADGSVTIFTR